MATAAKLRIGPADHGRKLTLRQFHDAEWQEGWLYELARGVVVVTDVPGLDHGMVVYNLARMFHKWNFRHPRVIRYLAGGAECRVSLPGMQSDRHPDKAVYLMPSPQAENIWARWLPSIVVEVVNPGREARNRDYKEKREEYLRAAVLEYWILDPKLRKMLALRRTGDVWEELAVPAVATYRTHLLPGLIVRPAKLLEVD